jgi:Flp pilus assembly protein TadG
MSQIHLHRSELSRGQALLEFALIFPVFVLLLFGIIDAGRAILTYNTVASAARNGARVAIVNQATSGAVNSQSCDTTSGQAWAAGCAVYSTHGTLPISTANVRVVYMDPTDTTTCLSATGYLISNGCLAEVTVTSPFTPITPVIGQFFGTMTISSTSKVPVERVCSTEC